MKLLRSHIFALLFIFIFALFLRLWNLQELPHGFHRDEIMNGYVGHFILQNGVDLYGNAWPVLYFDNFGDFPNVIPMYLSGLFSFIFGPSIFAVRFPIALFGALTVLPVFFISRKIFKKEWIGLSGAFLVAVTPWHIVLSRATAEGITAAFVYLVAVLLIMQLSEKFSSWKLIVSALLCGLTYFLYPSYRIIVPLTWLAVPFLVSQRRNKVILALVAVVFFASTIGISQTEWGRGRFEQTSIFAKNQDVDALTQRLVLGSVNDPVWLTRMYHNKAVVGGREFVHQYMSYFSGEFLFSNGGLPQRYGVPDAGLIYYGAGLFLLLLLVPAYMWKYVSVDYELKPVIKEEGKKFFAFLIWILLITPIPAALTRDDVPNVHRTALFAVIYVFPVMFGIAHVQTMKFKKFAKVSVAVFVWALIVIEGIYFARLYTTHADRYQSLERHDEIRQVVHTIQENKNKYDRIYVPARQQLALQYLFAENRFDADLAGQFKSEIYIKSIDNIYFSREDCPAKQFTAEIPDGEKGMVIQLSDCVDSFGLNKIGTIVSAIGVNTYDIFTN